MNNKVYITKTKPGVFERNARFKLTSNCVTNVQHKRKTFGCKVCRKSEDIDKMVKQKPGLTMSILNKKWHYET